MLDTLCILFVQVTITNFTHTQTSYFSLFHMGGTQTRTQLFVGFINRVGGFAAPTFVERKRLQTEKKKRPIHSFQALAFTSIQVITSFFCICTGKPHKNQNLRSAIFFYPPKPLLQLLLLTLHLTARQYYYARS